LECATAPLDADERHRTMNVHYPIVHAIRRAHAERQEVAGDFPATDDILLERGRPALKGTFPSKATNQKAEGSENRRRIDVGHGIGPYFNPRREKSTNGNGSLRTIAANS
jgi:hypothetical protein